VNDLDGEAYFYDINALSNLSADAIRAIGFERFVPLVDFNRGSRQTAGVQPTLRLVHGDFRSTSSASIYIALCGRYSVGRPEARDDARWPEVMIS